MNSYLSQLVVITSYGSMGIMFPGGMTIRIFRVRKYIKLPYWLEQVAHSALKTLKRLLRDTRLFPWLLLYDTDWRLVRRSADKVGNKDPSNY